MWLVAILLDNAALESRPEVSNSNWLGGCIEKSEYKLLYNFQFKTKNIWKKYFYLIIFIENPIFYIRGPHD